MVHNGKQSFFRILILLGLALPSVGIAQLPAPSKDPDSVATEEVEPKSNQIEIVLRFSKELFESLTQQEIKMTLPISRTVEGIEVTGSVVGKGNTNIQLNELADRAEFIIKVPGTADAQFSGDVGPATAHSTAVVTFDTCKRIAFDGKKFYQGKTGASSNPYTCVNQICPRRRGPIGKIVKKVGWCIARKSIGDINQAVEEVANEILADMFDERATELLEGLNEMMEEIDKSRLQKTIDKYFPETKSYIYHLRTAPDSILAGVGGPDAEFPELPPVKSHVELWLKTRPLEAAFLEMLADWNVAHDVLREILPADEAKLISEDLSLETVEGWSVLRIGIKKKIADSKNESEDGSTDRQDDLQESKADANAR